MDLLKTALYDDHVQLGAKMVAFAGFSMPVQYKSIQAEHAAVRNRAGLFDVSHMGEFILKGPGSLPLLRWISANDAANLAIGQAHYSYLPNALGGVVDDVLVYRLADQTYMMVVNAANIDKDWKVLVEHNTFGAEIHNISNKTALLALQGPLAQSILQQLTPITLADLRYYTAARGELAGVENVLISATGYTGSGGFELYFDAKDSSFLWKAILEAGKLAGLEPAGLGARDTLRLEMGYILYGQDLDDETSPIEAGLGWVTKFTRPFIGETPINDIQQAGVGRKLIGFKMLDRSIPRGHYAIKNAQGEWIGEVRSGTQSPTLKIGIGLGYVNKPYFQAGQPIFIEIRDGLYEAVIVKPPFLVA